MADYGKNDEADREILRELLGDEAAKERGIELTDRKYGQRFYAFIRASFPSLSPHEATQAWDETLLGLLERARAGRLRDDKSLLGLLYRICWRRAADILRRRRPTHGDVGRLAEIALDGLASEIREHPLYFKELLSQVGEAIRRLAPKQREVWEIYADLGFEASLRELTAEVNRRHGTQVSEKTVRKRLEAGRNVLRARLRRVFREWFGTWFDRWFSKLFKDWLDRNFDARPPDGLEDGDEDTGDGETET